MADNTETMDNAQTLDEVVEMYRARGVGQPLGFGHRVAILVIDFQQAYTRTWRAKSLEPIEQTARLLEAARAQGLPVYYTYQGYDPEHPVGGIFGLKAPTLLEFTRGSWSCEIDPLIAPAAADLVIEKSAPSAFFKSDLADRLVAQGVDTVVTCGTSLSGCVRASVVEGMSHGFRMIVPEPCVSDASEPSLRTSLMEITIKYGDVVTFDEALAGIKASQTVLV
jgi:maleamate amidohydrolase